MKAFYKVVSSVRRVERALETLLFAAVTLVVLGGTVLMFIQPGLTQA